MPFASVRLRRVGLLLAVLGGIALAARATPPAPQPLLTGVVYAAAAPTAFADSPATDAQIVDLRGVQTLPSDLAVWAQATGPIRIVLLDATNAAPAAPALAHRAANVLTLAPAGTAPAPDLPVDVTTDELAHTLTAIAAGADLSTLAQPLVKKRRFDESTLVNHLRGNLADPVETPAPSAPPGPDAARPADGQTPAAAAPQPTPPPPVDLMLQRAVQVIAGLRALGRG